MVKRDGFRRNETLNTGTILIIKLSRFNLDNCIFLYIIFMDAKKTILIINKFCPLHPKAGGAEKNLLEIFSRIGKTHEVILLSALFPGARQEEIYQNIRIIRIGSSTSENVIRIHLLLPFALRKYLRIMKPDILFEDESVLPFFTPLLYPKQKKIVMIHGFNRHHFFPSQRFPFSLIAFCIEKLFFLFYHKETIIVVSEWMKETLLRHKFLHVHKILNGVDEVFFSIQKQYAPRPTVLFFGRLEGRKGVNFLLNAFPFVKEKIPSIHFIIAGKRFFFGETLRLKKIINRFQKMYSPDQIQFTGYVSETQKQELLSKAWLVVVPSRIEGYGISVIEASATGTFVIANNTEGLRESVKDRETGILINCTDPKNLSEKIIEWLNKEKLHTQEKECRAWASTHSWEKGAKEMESIIFNQ